MNGLCSRCNTFTFRYEFDRPLTPPHPSHFFFSYRVSTVAHMAGDLMLSVGVGGRGGRMVSLSEAPESMPRCSGEKKASRVLLICLTN